jgi:uncharacterized membrane protein
VDIPDQKVQGRDASRIESFSDNIFAIALTLLVLTIKVPTIPTDDQPGYLLQQLGHQWPSYFTYVVSFFTVLLMWINHHVMFERVQKADHALMLLNGLMLLPVTLVPFPTSLLAVFIWHPQAKYAAALFAGSYVLIVGMYKLVWAHITRLNQRQGIDEDETRLRRMTRKIRIVFVLYVGAFCVAFIAPLACIGACFVLTIYLALPELRNQPE